MAKSVSKEPWYTFDDVLILPGKSSIEPREASLRASLVPGFELETPFLSAAMDRVTEARMAIALHAAGGLGILHRNNTIDEQVAMAKECKKADVRVGAAVGPYDHARAKALVAAGVDVVVVDCAHGHNGKVIASAKEIKKLLKKVPLIVGNIATADAARDLAGVADAVKVGIGPGSICTTRVVSGVGVPQLTAILEVAGVAKKKGMRIIADGGMKTSGDAAKALAAGADLLMFGNLFAGTDEAPGEIIEQDGKMYKEYRGMGSRAVMESKKSDDRYLTAGRKAVAEGVSGLVPAKGGVADVVETAVSGIQVAFGYVGAKSIAEFQKRARLIRITDASLRESVPHSLINIQE